MNFFPRIGPLQAFAFMAVLLALAGCASPPTDDNAAILKVGRGVIRIDMATNLPVSRAEIVEWVRRGAVAVTNYLGTFPVKHLVVAVESGGYEPIGDGVTHGASSIEVRLGDKAREMDLRQDWVMTHEMFHLAFPTLDRRYLWMMEGLSDYLEPVARARAGQMTPEKVWREFAEGLPQGLPGWGDRGLDFTHSRERIYWGGNLYWLLADVRIRVQTNNRRGLDDAIRAIFKAGGNGGAEWSLDRVLDVGGKATGTTVLRDLYEELGAKPGNTDLGALWSKLGVSDNSGAVTFNDTAPWARFRLAITAPKPSFIP